MNVVFRNAYGAVIERQYEIDFRVVISVVLSDVFEMNVHNTVLVKGRKYTFSICTIFSIINKRYERVGVNTTHCMLDTSQVENQIRITWYLQSLLVFKYTFLTSSKILVRSTIIIDTFMYGIWNTTNYGNSPLKYGKVWSSTVNCVQSTVTLRPFRHSFSWSSQALDWDFFRSHHLSHRGMLGRTFAHSTILLSYVVEWHSSKPYTVCEFISTLFNGRLINFLPFQPDRTCKAIAP